MLMIKEQKRNTWKEEDLPSIFLESLNYLLQKLRDEFLPFYFHPKSNIFEKLSSIHLFNMGSWLARVIKKLESSKDTEVCRSIWSGYFQTKTSAFTEYRLTGNGIDLQTARELNAGGCPCNIWARSSKNDPNFSLEREREENGPNYYRETNNDANQIEHHTKNDTNEGWVASNWGVYLAAGLVAFTLVDFIRR